MDEIMKFLQDKKKATYILIGLCAAALFFVLVCPVAKVSASNESEGVSLSDYMKYKGFAGAMLILLPIAAGAMTYFLKEKKMRYIAGGVLFLGFFIFLLTLGKVQIPFVGEVAIKLGVGMIFYFLFTVAYFVANYFTKE